jgi:hypothetical protein
LGRLNRPAILWTAGGQIAVWLLGQVLLWGGAGAIWVGANFPNTARSVTTLACARGRFFNLTFALPNGETNSIRTPPN